MLLGKLLEPGGIFIYTAFDGKKVFDLLKNETSWDKYESEKLLYSIKKKYNTDEFTGINQKIDVLLPFSDGKYYTENLINTDILNEELTRKKIRLIERKSFGEYLESFSECKEKLYNQLTDVDKEYVSLYHVYIYRKDPIKELKVKTPVSKFKLNREYHEHEIVKGETKTEKINRLKQKWESL